MDPDKDLFVPFLDHLYAVGTCLVWSVCDTLADLGDPREVDASGLNMSSPTWFQTGFRNWRP